MVVRQMEVGLQGADVSRDETSRLQLAQDRRSQAIVDPGQSRCFVDHDCCSNLNLVHTYSAENTDVMSINYAYIICINYIF